MPRLAIVAGDVLQAEEEARAWLPAGVSVTRRGYEELSLDTMFADLGQPGMFAEDRALLYTNPLGLKFGKHDQERLAKLLLQLPSTTSLATVQVLDEESRKKADERLRRPEWRVFADGAELRDIRDRARGTGAARWLAQYAAGKGLKLTPRQAEQVVLICGGVPALARGECDKLLLARAGADQLGTITDAELDQQLSGTPAAKFYELLDHLLADPASAQDDLAEWFNVEAETYRLVYEIKRRLLQVRLLQRGEQVYPPYAVRQAQALGRKLDGKRLGLALEALAALEHRLKSGLFPAASSRLSELGALQTFAAALAQIMRA
jgi:DNA polymerase III delta subunit